MSTLAERLREAMDDAGIKQVQVARAAGIKPPSVADWLNGKTKNIRGANLVSVAQLLNVSEAWLADGVLPKERRLDSDWPFPSISEADVRALSPGQLGQLEGAIALAIGQLRLGVDVAPARRAAAPAPRPGGLVDIDAAADEFPMRIGGAAAPWEPGGKTTRQMEREGSLKLSLAESVVANVAPGDPPAANDKFEKVPELADVRLSAGDGIENHAEDQTGMIQFRRSFLRSVGADGGRARVVYAKGDSMEPVIRDGAALLVVPDEGLTLRDLAAGGIYAINYDGKMIVKAVAKDRLTGRWVARSFNDRYQDVPLENGAPVRVLGRVVWAGVRLA